MAVSTRKLSGYRVYCDESNTDSHKAHPVYGAILVALNDIRAVQQELAEWRRREEMQGELKWEKVRGRLRLKKYKSLVDLLLSLARHGSCCWILRYFAKFPVKHQCHLRVIIDERPLPKDAPEPYEPLKIILNHGIRKEFKTTTDVVTKVEPLNSKESDLLQVICVAMPIRTKSNLPDTSPPNSDCGT